MEALPPPPRRRETYTSLQLQRASDQLQEAIQNARRGRSTHGDQSLATSLSLLSDLSASSCSSDNEDDDDKDQENQPLNANAQVPQSNHEDRAEKPTPEQKLRRFMADSMGSTGHHMGASLSLKDLLASPLRLARDQHDGAATLKLQLAGESESGCVKEKEPPGGNVVLRKAKTGVDDDHIETQARNGIEMLQHDVEAQARANRDTQEWLRYAIDRINSFVEGVVGRSIHWSMVDQKTPLDAMTVEKLTDKWTEGLNKWKEETDGMKCSYEERINDLEGEMEKRVRQMDESFVRERDGLEAAISAKVNEANYLKDTVAKLEQSNAEKEKHDVTVQKLQLDIERLQMQNEDWQMRLQNKTKDVPDDSIPSDDAQEQHILSLLSQLKQSELRELQWEMLFEEQSHSLFQAQERLNMLLEDVNCSEPHASATAQNPSAHPSVSASGPDSDRRTSLASSGASSERHLNQQRIEILEEQLQDLKEQFQCDHQQFLYDQQKWDLEKKHLGLDVEEVHSVSVKVLKLLLIREKLLKKEEKKTQRRRDKLNNDELQLREKQYAIHGSLETALQECGVALLYVRQLAMDATVKQPSTTLPVKPIKLVRVIKRLKSLQHDIATPLTSTTHGNDSPTTSSSTSRAATSDRAQLRT